MFDFLKIQEFITYKEQVRRNISETNATCEREFKTIYEIIEEDKKDVNANLAATNEVLKETNEELRAELKKVKDKLQATIIAVVFGFIFLLVLGTMK